jgi:2-polyprenyl-3-methyl-5-hydroxy-6-metoxy-1,4-benzoquinol methylase
LWHYYRQVFEAGDHVLDVGCGTGIDAVHLASHGVRVTGIDIAPQMVNMFRHKAENHGIADRMKAHVGSVDDLSRWSPGRFDGIISAFAGLNTVPDLQPFAEQAASLLKPEGRILLHMLNRPSIWELINEVLAGRWQEAWAKPRTFQREFSVGNHQLVHYLRSARATYTEFFAEHFRPEGWLGIGVFRPVQRLPKVPSWILRSLGWLDEQFGSYPPFRSHGRFFVLDLRVRSAEEADTNPSEEFLHQFE